MSRVLHAVLGRLRHYQYTIGATIEQAPSLCFCFLLVFRHYFLSARNCELFEELKLVNRCSYLLVTFYGSFTIGISSACKMLKIW